MDLDTIQSTIKSWVAAVTSLPVNWELEPAGVITSMTPARVVLSEPSNLSSVGTDYVRFTDVDAPALVQPEVVGHREFDVQVRVTGRSSAGNKSAQYYLEKIRSALTYPSTIDTFETISLAWLTMDKTIGFKAPFEERFQSVAAATIRFRCPIRDAGDAQIGTLTTAVLSTKIENDVGTELPSPPNLDDVSITAE